MDLPKHCAYLAPAPSGGLEGRQGGTACSNNLPIDIFGLYREVIKHGGFVDNERYDDYNRWTGGINFGGKARTRHFSRCMPLSA